MKFSVAISQFEDEDPQLSFFYIVNRRDNDESRTAVVDLLRGSGGGMFWRVSQLTVRTHSPPTFGSTGGPDLVAGGF